MGGKNVFCVFGQEYNSRKKELNSLVRELEEGRESSLNLITVYSRDLCLEKAKELLFTYSLARRKIVVVKQAGTLSREIKEFFMNNMDKAAEGVCLIFEVEQDFYSFSRKTGKDKFHSYLTRQVLIRKVSGSGEDFSFSSLFQALRSGKREEVLYVLERLFLENHNWQVLGMQILGAMTKQACFIRNPEKQKKYLNSIWQADRRMKSEGVDPRLVIELLAVKLFSA